MPSTVTIVVLLLLLTLAGVGAMLLVFRLLNGLRGRLSKLGEQPPRVQSPRVEGPATMDGLVYLYADEFVKPAPRRPMGSIPRDRAYACRTGEELDCDDFARQLLYVVLTELRAAECLETRIVSREASFMPPYPHKQWELQLRQAEAFPSTPLCDSLSVGFELARKNRQRLKRSTADLSPEDEFFALEEILERGLKAIRQEMSFWERGTVCSDLRNYVETALVDQGFLIAPERDTWLDNVRTKRPTCNEQAVAALQEEAAALLRRVQTFRQLHGSAYALEPQKDEKGQLVDIDPDLLTTDSGFEEMPFDDVIRATIYEAIVAIKQLEPSGEAGI